MTTRKYTRLIPATAAIAFAITSAAYAESDVRTSTPSKMGDQSCQAWTNASGAERSIMVAWLAGFLDGEIAAVDYYQGSVKLPPLSVDLREMDSICKSYPSTSIRQNAIDTFLNGHP
jgi:hypothetical protein